ncbi:MAG: nucleotidyltransferase domain-containing protein, partial [Thermomicrobiales bacterium]
MTGDPALLRVAARFAADYAALGGVRAVVLGGSLAAGRDDGASDIDLYVYADRDPDIADRRRISAGGREIEIDNRYWETGDEWVD